MGSTVSQAVDDAADTARALGAKKVMPMAVSGAFHTPFMAPARERLRKAIDAAELREAEMPVYANVDARPHSGGDEWGGLLGAQLCSPVRWRQTLDHLGEAGARFLIELGPGNVRTEMPTRCAAATSKAPGSATAGKPASESSRLSRL